MTDAIRIRASSFAGLFDCPHRWEGEHILGMRKPANIPMALGSAAHAGTALFDTGRMIGKPRPIAEAVEVAVEYLIHPTEEIDKTGDVSVERAADIASALVNTYCSAISPRYTFHAVELDVGEVSVYVQKYDVNVILTGRLDRTRVVQGIKKPRLADIKTGGNACTKNGVVDISGKGIQAGSYQIITEQSTGEELDDVAEIIGMNTKHGAIGVGMIQSPKSQVLGGTDGMPSLIEYAASMLRTGLFPPNPRSMVCGEKYCVRWNSCPYHDRGI